MTIFSALKRSAFVLSLKTHSLAVLEEKTKEPWAQVARVSIISGLRGALYPLFDEKCVCHESEDYRRQLGIDDESLEKYAKYAEVDVEVLKKIVSDNDREAATTSTSTKHINFDVTAAAALVVLRLGPRYLPLMPLISAPVCFYRTREELKLRLTRYEKTAREIIHEVGKHKVQGHGTATDGDAGNSSELERSAQEHPAAAGDTSTRMRVAIAKS